MTQALEPARVGVSSDRFSDGYRAYALGLLCTIYVLNFVDRQIVTILQEPIKRDLGLSDTELGMLTGLAFALVYTGFGLPIAWLADRVNRTRIIAVAVAVWSAMTALCGTAQGFFSLLLFRIGVGIGEAGLSPPAHSLISDYFARERRATALSIYALGIPFGHMLGLFAGGWLNEAVGWRHAFYFVGVPGIVLALLAWFTLREPPRGMADGLAHSAEAADRPSLLAVARLLWQLPSFRHMAIGGALTAFVGYAVASWNPPFFGRIHGLTTDVIGLYLGLLSGIAGGLGIYLGGALADRLGKRDPRWALWLPALAPIGVLPLSIFVYLTENPYWAFVYAIIPAICGNFYQGPTFATTQALVPVRMRAMAAAILLLVLNIIGLGLGPLVTGMLSDALTEAGYGRDALRYALLIVLMVKIWSGLHYYLGARHLARDLERTRATG